MSMSSHLRPCLEGRFSGGIQCIFPAEPNTPRHTLRAVWQPGFRWAETLKTPQNPSGRSVYETLVAPRVFFSPQRVGRGTGDVAKR
jgi:hypothetical protein